MATFSHRTVNYSPRGACETRLPVRQTGDCRRGQSYTLRMSFGVMIGGKRQRIAPRQHCATKSDFYTSAILYPQVGISCLPSCTRALARNFVHDFRTEETL